MYLFFCDFSTMEDLQLNLDNLAQQREQMLEKQDELQQMANSLMDLVSTTSGAQSESKTRDEDEWLHFQRSLQLQDIQRESQELSELVGSIDIAIFDLEGQLDVMYNEEEEQDQYAYEDEVQCGVKCVVPFSKGTNFCTWDLV